MTDIYGGLEAGGTKFVCAVGTGPDDIRAETRFPTTTPAETIARTVAFFQEQQARFGKLKAIGIGSFGPVDLHPDSPTFGYITTTPKAGWAQTDMVTPLSRELGAPVGFDTDVNVAALGEWRWGAGVGVDSLIYTTIGTGIGSGIVLDGRLVHGLVHPETGHIFIPHDYQADPFAGSCPYHTDCFEGLATGPSMEKRWGQRAETLPPDHPAWPLEAHYIALAVANFVCMVSPQRIILGGGVMNQLQLFPMVRREVQTLLNGYVHAPQIIDDIDPYIVPPGLGNRSGVLGAIALAMATETGK